MNTLLKKIFIVSLGIGLFIPSISLAYSFGFMRTGQVERITINGKEFDRVYFYKDIPVPVPKEESVENEIKEDDIIVNVEPKSIAQKIADFIRNKNR